MGTIIRIVYVVDDDESVREALGSVIPCTVELFGVARMLAKTKDVSLSVPQGATLAEVFSALAERLLVLLGRVISPDRSFLTGGYACNLNGLDFVRSLRIQVSPGRPDFYPVGRRGRLVMHGFHGRVLYIDLHSGQSTYHDLAESRLRNFLGGSGLGTSLLYDYTPAGVDPLGAANSLIFTSAPLVGTDK